MGNQQQVAQFAHRARPGRALRDVVHAIDHAAKDDRIKAIVLELDGFMGGGQANIATVDDALTRFRKSGKPVHAWATAYSDDSWLLAAAASKIWLNPMGGVIITGPGGSRLYFAKALEKLQVDVNVFRVGTYKSFVEPFTRTAASPEAKAADQALAGSLWGSWLADAKRLRPKADVPAYIAQLPQRLGKFGGDSAKTALDAGLVDQLGSRDEFDAAMIELAGEDELSDWGHYTGVTLGDYLSATAKPLGERGDAVGVVYVTGNIVDGEAPRGTAGFGSNFLHDYAKTLSANTRYRYQSAEWLIDAGANASKSITWRRTIMKGHFNSFGSSLLATTGVRVNFEDIRPEGPGITRVFDANNREIDLFDLRALAPLRLDAIQASLARTGRLPDLLAPGGQVLLCLNAPELGVDFLQDQMRELAPELQFVERVANPAVFADLEPGRALKVLVYQAPELEPTAQG